MLIMFINFLTLGFGLSYFFNSEKRYIFFDLYFLGLATTTTLLSTWSLFLPNNIYSLIFIQIVCAFLLLLFFYKGILKIQNLKKYNFKIGYFAINTLLVILVFLCSLVPPKIFDSYLYHINSIQWIENFGVVPGLANFHDRFGFNSSIFVLSATYSFREIFNQILFCVSSLSIIVFFTWLIKNIFYKKGYIVVYSLLFFYYFFIQYILDISSPSTDLLPNIIISYLLLRFLEQKDVIEKPLLIIVLPFFLITLKLSMFPSIIISFWFLFKNFKSKKNLISAFLLITAIILPWSLRTIITTGYILYPFESIDFFNFDWEVPKQSVEATKGWVYSWARLPFAESSYVLNLSFKQWILIWWEIATIQQRRFYLLFLISIFFFIISMVFYKRRNEKLTIVYLTCILGVIFWLNAPDIRFSFGFILTGGLLIIICFNKILQKRIVNYFSIFILLLVMYNMLFKAFDVFNEDYKLSNINSYLYKPKDVSLVSRECGAKFLKKEINIKNGDIITLYGPDINNFVRCFDKFPCTAYLNESFELRGNSLKEGFKNKKQ